MDQALHMIMIPVTDMAVLRKFYLDDLRWKSWGPDMPGSFLVRAGTALITFVPRDYLAAESGMDLTATTRCVNAIFVESKESVEAQVAVAIGAGATLTSPIRDRDGGLYSGYFCDPEGNGWEIVWSPVMRPSTDGGLDLVTAKQI